MNEHSGTANDTLGIMLLVLNQNLCYFPLVEQSH